MLMEPLSDMKQVLWCMTSPNSMVLSINYNEMLSRVVKLETIQLVITLALSHA